jgi:predicted dinucleotide-binding enzyme
MKIGIVGTGNVGATPAATTDTANQKQVVILRSREGSSPSHPKPSRARR